MAVCEDVDLARTWEAVGPKVEARCWLKDDGVEVLLDSASFGDGSIGVVVRITLRTV